VNGRLRPTFRTIWFVGGGVVSAECLRLGLADEVRYSILPILIGDGIPFFEKLDRDIALHLAEVKAYKSGMVELRYEVRGHRGESRNATLYIDGSLNLEQVEVGDSPSRLGSLRPSVSQGVAHPHSSSRTRTVERGSEPASRKVGSRRARLRRSQL
jgi:hypothetical protein